MVRRNNRRYWRIFKIYLDNKIKNSKEINYPEIEKIYGEFCHIANELEFIYIVIKEEKILSDLCNNKISIDDTCELLEKEKDVVEKFLDNYKKYIQKNKNY